MFTHIRLTQHVSDIIMPIVRRQTVKTASGVSLDVLAADCVESGHELSAL